MLDAIVAELGCGDAAQQVLAGPGLLRRTRRAAANRGVFLATSTFTCQAIEFANSVERMALVDGTRLALLIIEHGVSVSHRIVQVPKLDSDYFEYE